MNLCQVNKVFMFRCLNGSLIESSVGWTHTNNSSFEGTFYYDAKSVNYSFIQRILLNFFLFLRFFARNEKMVTSAAQQTIPWKSISFDRIPAPYPNRSFTHFLSSTKIQSVVTTRKKTLIQWNSNIRASISLLLPNVTNKVDGLKFRWTFFIPLSLTNDDDCKTKDSIQPFSYCLVDVWGWVDYYRVYVYVAIRQITILWRKNYE